MRAALLFAAALAAGGLAVPAFAASSPPTLNGPYVISWSEICSAQVGVQGSSNPTGLLSGLNIESNGEAEQGIGTITFTPTKAGALTGTFAIAGWESQGSLAVLQGVPDGSYSGTAMPAPAVNTLSGKYTVSATAPTVTLTPTGKNNKPTTFKIIFSPTTGQTVQAVLLGSDSTGCSLQVSATQQLQ